MEGTRANLYMSKLPIIYWGYAILHQNCTRNMSPHHSKKMKSPFELLYSKVPNINNVKVFGCRAFAHRPDETRSGKLDTTAIPGIYLGKSIESDGIYILLDTSDKIMLTKHAKYREDEYQVSLLILEQFTIIQVELVYQQFTRMTTYKGRKIFNDSNKKLGIEKLQLD